jgi:hypothetical protein
MQRGANIGRLCIDAAASIGIDPEGAYSGEKTRQQHNPDLCSVHFPYHINPDLSSRKWHYLNDNCGQDSASSSALGDHALNGE